MFNKNCFFMSFSCSATATLRDIISVIINNIIANFKNVSYNLIIMQQALTYLRLILEDNEQLTNNYVAYNNVLIKARFQKQNSVNNKINLSEEQKKELEYYMTNFRSYSTRIKIKLNSIKEKINLSEEQKKGFLSLYEKINEAPLPPREICEDFVQAINDILADKISAYEALNKQQEQEEYTESSRAPDIQEEE